MALPEKKLGKYVYLASLLTGSEKEQELAKFVQKELVFKNDFGSTDARTEFYKKINDACKVLQDIANNERNKEEKAIRDYKIKLEKWITDEEIPKDLKKQLKEHLKYISSFKDGVKMEEIQFIKNINIMTQDIAIFKKRLGELQNIPANPYDVYNRLPYRLEDDLDNFVRDLGKKSRRKNSQTNRTIKDALSKLINDELRNKCKDIPSFEPALYSLLYVDLAQTLDQEGISNLYALSLDQLQEKLESYINRQNSTLTATNANRVLQNDIEGTLNLIKSINTFLGFKYIDEKQYQDLVERQKALKNTKDKDKIKKILDGKSRKEIKERIQTYNDSISQNLDKHLTFTFKTKQSHGFMQEIVEALQKMGISVEKNTATDTLVLLGACTLYKHDDTNQQELRKLLRDLGEILNDNFKDITKIKRIEDFDEAIRLEKETNNKIQEAIATTSAKLDQAEDDFSTPFISYDTLKLYRTYETGSMQNYTDEFHGRQIQILSALTKLYAAPGLSSALINKDVLITFLLNISEATLGYQNKQPLETYLSLFAGLLMFDDISSMASEALNNIRKQLPISNSVQQLHLYGINNIYYPISIILDNMIKQVKYCLSDLSSLSLNSKGTAVVTLSAPKTINYKGDATIQTWNDVSNKTIQQTKIQIAFLAGYSNYINDLYKNILPS